MYTGTHAICRDINDIKNPCKSDIHDIKDPLKIGPNMPNKDIFFDFRKGGTGTLSLFYVKLGGRRKNKTHENT